MCDVTSLCFATEYRSTGVLGDVLQGNIGVQGDLLQRNTGVHGDVLKGNKGVQGDVLQKKTLNKCMRKN